MADLRAQTKESVREFQTLVLMACLERLGGEVALTTEEIGRVVRDYRLVVEMQPEENRCLLKLVSLEGFHVMQGRPVVVVRW